MRLEFERYQKQICLDEVGIEGQKNLRAAKVLCIGIGGLGAPLSLYLASSGVGTIGLIDGDCIEASNLARQILYRPSDIGKAKVYVAKERLLECNPECKVISCPNYFDSSNALNLISQYDVIADCSDNFATRYLISDACNFLDKINVFAAVYKHQGQLAIFNGAKSACFRCLFNYVDPKHSPRCQAAGILSTSVGLVGLWQAHEIIKVLLNLSKPNPCQLLTLDLLNNTLKKFTINKDPNCPCCNKQLDFDALQRPDFCKVDSEKWIDEKRYAKLKKVSRVLTVDVREESEYQQEHIPDAVNIPLARIGKFDVELEQVDNIILYCKSGLRSEQAYKILEKQIGQPIYLLEKG